MSFTEQSFSKMLRAEGWVPGLPGYFGPLLRDYEINYFYGEAWHRRIK